MRAIKFMCVVVLGCCVSTAWAKDPVPAGGAPAPDAQALQEMMAKLAEPGPQHAQLQALVGEYTCHCTCYQTDPTQPVVEEATATITSLLDGRYIQQDFVGTFNGQEMVGRGTTGYDNAKQKFVGTWLDNHGTGILTTEGTWDEKSKTMTETGSMYTPAGEMKMKMVTTHKSDDQFHFTMYMVSPEGDESKSMEIVYTRKK